MRIVVCILLLTLAASCAHNERDQGAMLADLTATLAPDMGVAVNFPSKIVPTYSLSDDGRTRGVASCRTAFGRVTGIAYADSLDFCQPTDQSVVVHELHHARQCQSGRLAALSRADAEREAYAIQGEWFANNWRDPPIEC